MANLYITSAEVFSGKSALCLGLGLRFRADHLKVGYMKPVNVNCPTRDGMPFDADVIFAKKIFDMPDPTSVLAPVAFAPGRLHPPLNGSEPSYESRLLDAFAQVSAGRDILVLEGGRSWREGYVAGLPSRRVVQLLRARALIVLKYQPGLLADRALAAQDYFGDALMGVVVNEAPPNEMERLQKTLVPYLTGHGLPVLGILPRDPVLAATTVGELAEGLHAEILCAAERSGDLVEQMIVGAMTGESALSYFRRLPNKAVITGGDRADIQLAALETSTRCLILSGNLYPSPPILSRAEELGVPVLLTDQDTLAAVEVIERFLGHSRFQQPEKVARFGKLLDAHMDFAALYERLSVKPG